ncbi:MAG: hypothetical protein CVT67_00125 [Actinobacteria bacterium HGW-Actinobacteria-7]|nr:MAG: hypothetical protein CVT67_00125 [Actinobacteria bacterium HGW-Actinobacteria-7]
MGTRLVRYTDYKPLPTWLRSLAWISVAALFVARLVIGSLGLDWRTEIVVSDSVTYLLPMVVVLFLAFAASVRTRGAVEHALWGMLAAATVLGFAAESYWTWYSVSIDLHGPPPGSWSYVLRLGAFMFLFFGVSQMTRWGSHGLVSRLRTHLDILGIGAMVFSVLYMGWTYPTMSTVPRASNAGAVVMALYPITGALLLLGTKAVFVGWKTHRWRVWERLTTASFGMTAASLLVTPIWYPAFLRSSNLGPTWLTTYLGAGYAILGVAAVYRLSAQSDEAIVEPWPMSSEVGWWKGRFRLMLMVLGLPLMGWAAVSIRNTDNSRTLVGATATLALAIVGRALLDDVMRTRNLIQHATDQVVWPTSRAQFERCVLEAIARACEAGAPLSLVIFAEPNAPAFNQSPGTSDRYQSAARIAEAIRSSGGQVGSSFRLSNSQFAVVCERTDVHEAATFARRLWLRYRRSPGESDVAPELFSGVAGYPQHGQDVQPLLAAAQLACQQASGTDGEPVAIYDPESCTKEAGPVDSSRLRIIRATVRSLAQTVDARDPLSQDHSTNVSELATALAQVLDLPDEQVHMIGLAALMHDVGKVGLSDYLLLKPAPLTAEEQLEYEEHVMLGEMILAPANIDEVLPAVRHHHERWDGTGYPDGLSGHDIPLEARVLAVCDAFEKLTADREHGETRDTEDVLLELERGSGTLFDPVISAVFCRLIRGLRTPQAESSDNQRKPTSEPNHAF